MVLAREESIYIQERIEERQQPKPNHKNNKNKKPKKNYRFEKVIISLALTTVLASSILLLTRFMAITEAKHRVNRLQYQIERLEVEREKLRVEVEKVSKSGWIESEAMTRLGMVYPSPDQMIYININPTKVAMLASELKKSNNLISTEKDQNKAYSNFISRLVSNIRI